MVIRALEIPTIEIDRFCQRWGVTELALFGSVLRPDFNDESDVDVLIQFGNSTRWGLFDLVKMEKELKAIFGREIDLVERAAVENSENYIRRKEILNHTYVIYSA